MSDFKTVVEGIVKTNEEVKSKVSFKIDNLLKPIGSLGKLEDIAIQIAGITGELENKVNKKCVIVMCSDNGIWEEGVSKCPQEITAIQTANFTRGICAINVLSRQVKSDVKVVDIGVNSENEIPGVIHKKIRKSTWNFSKEPAMERSEAIKAIEVGIDVVESAIKEGYNLFGTGEMGICNTSTSSAVLMAFSGLSAEVAVGKGSGLTETDFANKKMVIERGLSINNPDKNDPIDVLSKVGGFDIAGLVGCFLCAAYHRVPIVIDGFISASAALIAYKLNPLAKDYMIPSHQSLEPGYMLVMEQLGLEPMLNLDMRLGEGTGCALAFHIIESALAMTNEMGSFNQENIDNDFLVDIREE